MAKLDDAMRRVAGEVAHALDTEDMVRRVGAEYKIDPNDDKSLTELLKTFRKNTDSDKLRALATEKQKVEGLNQRLQDTANQIHDTVEHMHNLDEIKKFKEAGKPKDPQGEWAYDLWDLLGQALLGLDPKEMAKTLVLGLFTLAGADLIKDHVKELDDTVDKIEDSFNKAVGQFSEFSRKELITDTQTLQRLRKDSQDTSTKLLTALDEYQQARQEVMAPGGNVSRETAIVGSLDSAVKSSLETMLAAAKDMTGTPLLNTDLTKLLSPLGKYKRTSGDLALYLNGNVENGFNVSGSVKQARIEEMAAALPDALEKLEALNTAIARLKEWEKLLDHVLKI